MRTTTPPPTTSLPCSPVPWSDPATSPTTSTTTPSCEQSRTCTSYRLSEQPRRHNPSPASGHHKSRDCLNFAYRSRFVVTRPGNLNLPETYTIPGNSYLQMQWQHP